MQPDTKTCPHADVFSCLAGGRGFRMEVNWLNMKNALVGHVFHAWRIERGMGKQLGREDVSINVVCFNKKKCTFCGDGHNMPILHPHCYHACTSWPSLSHPGLVVLCLHVWVLLAFE